MYFRARKQLLSDLMTRLMNAALAIFVLGTPQATPNTVTIPNEPECESCRIELEHVVRLGAQTPEEGLVCEGSDVGATEERFYVSGCRDQEILVFDHAGKLEGRVGREGSGPGEFVGELRVTGTHDGGMLVFSGDGRITRFDRDLRIQDSDRVRRQPLDAVVFADGTTVLFFFALADRHVRPLHIYEESGKTLRVLRTGAMPIESFDQQVAWRWIGKAQDSEHFWAAQKDSYRLELLDLEGNVEQIVVRDGWFRGIADASRGPDEPLAELHDVMEQSQGVLWTRHLVHRRVPRSEANPYGSVHLLEALDVEDGVVLARKEVPFPKNPVRFAGEFGWRLVTEEANEFIDIFRLVVTNK